MNLALGSVVVAVLQMVVGHSEVELAGSKASLDGPVAVEEDSTVGLGNLAVVVGNSHAELGDLFMVLGVLAAELDGLAVELQVLVAVL